MLRVQDAQPEAHPQLPHHATIGSQVDKTAFLQPTRNLVQELAFVNGYDAHSIDLADDVHWVHVVVPGVETIENTVEGEMQQFHRALLAPMSFPPDLVHQVQRNVSVPAACPLTSASARKARP